jgi:hypothetical protein
MYRVLTKRFIESHAQAAAPLRPNLDATSDVLPGHWAGGLFYG